MTTTLYRETLDSAECDEPGCDEDRSLLFLHTQCHSGRGVDACYDKREGVLKISCPFCHRFLCKIAVASAPAIVVH
jgi:hypothetical protein